MHHLTQPCQEDKHKKYLRHGSNICQVDTGQNLTTSENGRKKIIEANMIRLDHVFEKLKLIDNRLLSHHVSNDS